MVSRERIEIHYRFGKGEERVKVLDRSEIIIGRPEGDWEPDLDLSPDETASRRHARLWVEKETCWVEDLESGCGTVVNGSLIAEPHQLSASDVIGIGKTTLKVTLRKPAGHEGPDLTDLTVSKSLDYQSPAKLPAEPMDTGFRGRLESLFDLPLQFGAQTKLDDLLKLITTRTVEVITGAQRGALLVLDPRQDRLLLKAHVSSTVPAVSETLCRRCLHEKRGFIWRRGSSGETSRSLSEHKIESGMYAPLLWKDKALGVIRVDSPAIESAFSDDGLRFLLVVAHYAAMAMAVHQQQEEIKQNAKVLERLLTNFSPKVRGLLLNRARNGKLRPGGEKSEVTILFTDMRGFTATSEGLEPEEILELLDSYFGELVNIIFKFDGTIDKFIGDAILAVFGSPEVDANQYEHALCAAWAMQRAMASLNAQRETEGKLICQIGIGLHCGEVLHGFIGSAERLEFTVIGDAVNKASRYCTAAGAGEIVLSPSLFERVFRLAQTEQIVCPTKHEGEWPAYRVTNLRDEALVATKKT